MNWNTLAIGVSVGVTIGAGGAALLAGDTREAVAEGVAKLTRDAKLLAPLYAGPLVDAFLEGADDVPEPEEVTVYLDREKREWINAADASALDDEARDALEERTFTADQHFEYRYGSPLAWTRALDFAEDHMGAESFKGMRVCDFGYGNIGHLEISATLGAQVTGVDVDALLPHLYKEAHEGPVELGGGNLLCVNGRWPNDTEIVERVRTRGPFHLFTSKNTLKKGYVNPDRPRDPDIGIDLEMSGEEFLRHVWDSLEPGGVFVVYNISPAQRPEPEPIIPWADGRFPWAREVAEQIGFEVIAFDEDDTEFARTQGEALGWREMGMDLETDTFAMATVLRRPAD